MLPEAWQGVQRLLLICAFQDEDVVAQIAPALQQICQVLPDADIHFLMVRESDYSFVICGSPSVLPSTQSLSVPAGDYSRLVTVLREFAFDAAIIFTAPGQSPFSLGYLCYLANIPIRSGQSLEFGGGVLSHSVRPASETLLLTHYHLHLLQAAGLTIAAPAPTLFHPV